VAEIRYGKMAAAERELKQAEERFGFGAEGRSDAEGRGRRRRHRETREQVRGFPRGAFWKSEVQKLVHMEERLGQAVVDRMMRWHAFSNAVRRQPCGTLPTPSGHRLRLFSRPNRRGETELARALAEFLFRRRKTHDPH